VAPERVELDGVPSWFHADTVLRHASLGV